MIECAGHGVDDLLVTDMEVGGTAALAREDVPRVRLGCKGRELCL